MGTQIFITSPGGETEEIKIYDNCSTSTSASDQSGSFSITIPSGDKSIFDKYPVGSDVKIIQDGNVFRGWILNPPKSIDGPLKILQLEGMSYTGRTQKVMVTETYSNWDISDIVVDLFTKYAPEYNFDSIVPCNKVISIKFNDAYLFEAIEKLSMLAGYEWFIDEPMPELIDSASQPSGWSELVDTIIHKVFYPSENLYPSEGLYPC